MRRIPGLSLFTLAACGTQDVALSVPDAAAGGASAAHPEKVATYTADGDRWCGKVPASVDLHILGPTYDPGGLEFKAGGKVVGLGYVSCANPMGGDPSQRIETLLLASGFPWVSPNVDEAYNGTAGMVEMVLPEVQFADRADFLSTGFTQLTGLNTDVKSATEFTASEAVYLVKNHVLFHAGLSAEYTGGSGPLKWVDKVGDATWVYAERNHGADRRIHQVWKTSLVVPGTATHVQASTLDLPQFIATYVTTDNDVIYARADVHRRDGVTQNTVADEVPEFATGVPEGICSFGSYHCP